jgi:hypothetical protein
MDYGSVREDMEAPLKYKRWVDEIRESYPDLEIFAIDGIVSKDGKDYILEVNGSSSGLAPQHEEEYLNAMLRLVRSRILERTEHVAKERNEVEKQKDVQILNLNNHVEELELELGSIKECYLHIQSKLSQNQESRMKSNSILVEVLFLLLGFILAVIMFISFSFEKGFF